MSTPRGSTPAQTVGPYLSLGLPWPDGPDVVPEGTPGACWIRGSVFDGAGEPVPDALVETWQADPRGHFDHPADPRRASGFRGFGRCPTDVDGAYAIRTLVPGPVPGPDGTTQAPHLDVSVFARGLLHRVVTRIYLPDPRQDPRPDPDQNTVDSDVVDRIAAVDPVLAAVPAERRHTLVALAGPDGYRFDIRLQGAGAEETVFFAL